MIQRDITIDNRLSSMANIQQRDTSILLNCANLTVKDREYVTLNKAQY